MGKIKVLYIITLSNLGGAQVHLKEVISNLPKNIIPYILIGSNGWLEDELKKVTRDVYIIPELVHQISPWNDIKVILRIRKIIFDIKPDIVHCHSSKAGIVGRIAAKLASVPSVFTAHGWAFTEGVSSKKRLVYQQIEKLAGYLTEKIICVSDYDRKLALTVMPNYGSKLITIHNGICNANKSLIKEIKNENQSFKLIMVARFSDQKDHKSVINALKFLKNDNIDVHISFVGDGPNLEGIQNLVQKWNLVEQVRFLGRRTDITNLLPQYDGFLLISNWEGFPISILEAMRAKLPVIASDVGGVSEEVKDGETGFLLPHGNEVCLAEKIKYCCTHKKKLREMGQQGCNFFKERFTSEIMMKKILDVYQDVVDNKNR